MIDLYYSIHSFISVILVFDLTILGMLYLFVMGIAYGSLNPKKIDQHLFSNLKREFKELFHQKYYILCIFLAFGIAIVKVLTGIEAIVAVGGSIALYTLFELLIQHISKFPVDERENLFIMNKAWLIGLNIANVVYQSIEWKWLNTISEKLGIGIYEIFGISLSVEKISSILVFGFLMFLITIFISFVFIVFKKPRN